MSVATGGPMQNEKSSATANASNVARQGVCQVTPLNTTVTTTAAKRSRDDPRPVSEGTVHVDLDLCADATGAAMANRPEAGSGDEGRFGRSAPLDQPTV